jgi:hypothetical protein
MSVCVSGLSWLLPTLELATVASHDGRYVRTPLARRLSLFEPVTPTRTIKL